MTGTVVLGLLFLILVISVVTLLPKARDQSPQEKAHEQAEKDRRKEIEMALREEEDRKELSRLVLQYAAEKEKAEKEQEKFAAKIERRAQQLAKKKLMDALVEERANEIARNIILGEEDGDQAVDS